MHTFISYAILTIPFIIMTLLLKLTFILEEKRLKDRPQGQHVRHAGTTYHAGGYTPYGNSYTPDNSDSYSMNDYYRATALSNYAKGTGSADTYAFQTRLRMNSDNSRAAWLENQAAQALANKERNDNLQKYLF